MNANDLPVVDEATVNRLCEGFNALGMSEGAKLIREYVRLHAQNEERGAEIERLKREKDFQHQANVKLLGAKEHIHETYKALALQQDEEIARLQARLKELEGRYGGVDKALMDLKGHADD